MRRLCVTGGSGLLGCKILQASGETYETLSLDITEAHIAIEGRTEHVICDVSDMDALSRQLNRFQPDVIIHTAAFTDVDGCELDEEKARRINVDATKNVVAECSRSGAKLIHLSTDYVFDGESGPYTESDDPNPINVYGRTKLESERAITDILDDFVIARAMILYGFVEGIQKNFVTWVVDALKRRERIRIVDDQFGTPTLADDLASALLVLDRRDAKGVYHTAGNDCLSRYEFAMHIAEVFGLDKGLISRSNRDEFQQHATRPLKSGLVNHKIVEAFGFRFGSIADGLHAVKHQMGRE